VHDRVNGRLLTSREPGDWAEAIVSSLDAAALPAMREAARSNAATYTWCRTARAIGDLVERLQSGALLLCR
jgi:glycosyltransferase involved in cell wall biosynthesis